MIAVLAAPSLLACEDCPDGLNCVNMTGGARFCEFFPDGGCAGIGTCRQLSASLHAEYRVAAVRVIEQGTPLPPAQPKPAAAQTVSK